jgi:uncharacterized protein (DUF488 family)
MKIYTIGHSNRELGDFIDLLKFYQLNVIADVRRYPGSPKNPQFNSGNLKQALQQAGLVYLWFGEQLGAFRPEGYENFMQSDVYQKGIVQLSELASRGTLGILCAEKLFATCHRVHISDSLTAKGFQIWHILDRDNVTEHQRAQILKDNSSQLSLF